MNWLAEAASIAPEAIWERMISYGALGVICAYLLWERRSDRKLEREIRKGQFEAINDNTMATVNLSSSIRELKNAIWLFVGKTSPREETPPPRSKPPTSHPKSQ